MNKHFKYEEIVIDPILNIIKDNQDYLTKPENLPQLAKLGFIFQSLYYSGRMCWGYSSLLRGRVKKKTRKDEWDDGNYSDCEDNPKDKIEMCEPKNERIEDFIYDAWAQHVSSNNLRNFEEFYKIVKEGQELTPIEIKLLKINKTFEDWVEIKTDDTYRYKSLYPDRKSVANSILCTIGSDYSYNKEGFVFEKAGGADQNLALYGDWKNAKLRKDIEEMIDKILLLPEVKATIDTDYEKRLEYKKKADKEKQESYDIFYRVMKHAGVYKDEEGQLPFDVIQDRMEKVFEENEKAANLLKPAAEAISERKKRKIAYRTYYPICNYSNIYAIKNKSTKFHSSYINAAIEVCNEILEHKNEEKENYKFAEGFIKKFGNKIV